MIIKDINLFDKDISKFSNREVFVEREIPYFFFKTLSKKNRVKVVNDICNELKSVKNIIEINNSRKAHLYDGIALVKFFYWLEKNLDKPGAAPLLCAGITMYSPLRQYNVSKGDKVDIIQSIGTIFISASGVALENGQKGEKIRVMNLSSEKNLVAWVLNEKKVTTQTNINRN